MISAPRTILRRAWPRALAVALASAGLGLALSQAGSAPLAAGGGVDYYSGPAGQVTKSALAIGAVSFAATGSATLAALRYDDNQIGRGTGMIGGLGIPVAPSGTFQVWGYRYVGDEAFRAWRLKAGPAVTLPRGATLGLYYLHFEDNAGGKSNGAIAELGAPVTAGLTARVSAARAATAAGPASTQGALGLTWAGVRHLELSGEAGLAENGALSTAPIPSRRGLELPLLGGGSKPGSSTRLDTTIDPTLLISVRLLFP